MPENKLHFWALFIYLYMNNKNNKTIVEVYKKIIKKKLLEKKPATVLTRRLSKILRNFLE